MNLCRKGLLRLDIAKVVGSFAKIIQVPSNSFFRECDLKIERFNTVKQTYVGNVNIDQVKQELKKRLDDKENAPSLHELYGHLKPFVYTAQTNDDIQLVIRALRLADSLNKALEKSSPSNESALSVVKLDVTLMRLLHSLGNSDLAIRCFEENSDIFKESIGAIIVLLDLLIRQQRYADVVAFCDRHIFKLEKVPTMLINATTLCLLKLNDKRSFDKMRSLIDIVRKKNQTFGVNSIVHMFFLAINQKEYAFAFDFLAKTKCYHVSLYTNLSIIGFSRLNCVEEALKSAAVIPKRSCKDDDLVDGRLFQLTINHLDEAISRVRSTEKRAFYKAKFDQLRASLEASDRVIAKDMIEYFCSDDSAIVHKESARKFKNAPLQMI